jgi:hypothetical protein
MWMAPACAFVCILMGTVAATAQTAAPQAANQGTTVRSSKIPGGTEVRVKVLDPTASDTAKIGDAFKVIVASDDTSGLPTGTMFLAHVTFALKATPTTPGEINIELSLPQDSESDRHMASDNGQPVVDDDASAVLTGRTAHAQGHVTGLAAAGGALLGFLRKGKLGDAIEGGAIGAVGGVAVDQSQKHSAGDVVLKPGSEINVKLDRPMRLKTIVVPDTD